MKLRGVFALSASVLFVTVFQVAAQEQPAALPNVLRIYREEVKQGKDAAHENTEAAFAKIYAKHKVPANYLGFTMTAGPSEAWFLEAHDSIKSIQDTDAFIEKSGARVETTKWDSMDGELRLNSRTLIAVLHPEVTYRADQFMQELPKTRYFGITMMRVKPYMDMQFLETGKQFVAAYQRAGIEQPVAVYQIVSGGAAGTYLLITPMKSLAAMDEFATRAKTLRESGGSERIMALYKLAAESVAASENYTLAINPKMSYVPKEMVAADPDFWTPKPAVTTAKPAPKTTDKSGGAH